MRPTEIYRLTTWGDRLLVVALAAITLGAFPLMGIGARKSDTAVIEVNGRPAKTISLKKDGNVSVTGVEGEAVFEVKDGKIHALTAPCTNKVCIHQGWTNMSWKLLVCVPNKVVVRPVGSSDQHGVDAVTW